MSTLTQYTASAGGESRKANREAHVAGHWQTIASNWQTQASAAAHHLRTDSPHVGVPAPMALLAWTTYIISPPAFPDTDSQLAIADRLATEPVDAHRVPVQRAAAFSAEPQTQVAVTSSSALRSSDAALGVHRQRFYPAQWKSSLVPQVDALLREHGHSIRWEGWDRSLPRLYLPVAQLSRLVLDLIRGIVRRINSPRSRGDELRVAVSWQSGAAQSLVLVFEHPRLELSAASIAPINAPRPADGSETHGAGSGEFLRVARAVRALGGSISVMRGPSSVGNGFRVSLPIDHRESLVRAWIEQVSTASGSSLASPGSPSPAVDINLFVIGRGNQESLAQLQAADARMQSLASSQDYIYRVGYGRWLWLTTAQSLPGFVSREPWRSQRVTRWKCPTAAEQDSSDLISLDSRYEAFNHSIARRELSSMIAREMERLIGYRVPPIDCLVPTRSVSTAARHGRWRVDAASQVPTNHTVSKHRKRWRYPI